MFFRAARVKAPDHQGAPWLDHSVFHFGAEKYPGPSLLKRALSLQVHLWNTSSAGSFNPTDVAMTPVSPVRTGEALTPHVGSLNAQWRSSLVSWGNRQLLGHS